MMKTNKCKLVFVLISLFFTSSIIYSSSQAVFSISTFFAIEDAYVSKNDPNLNYGNETLLRFSKIQKTYLKFTFNIDRNTLIRAKISFYLASDNDNDLEVLLSITPINWDEDNITWNNKPIRSDPLLKFIISGDSIKNYQIDITDFIDTNLLSLCLYTDSLGGYGYAREYSRAISTDIPKLTLTYESEISGNTPSIPNNILFIFLSFISTILAIISRGFQKKKIKIRS